MLSLITCTGFRPEAFALCQKYLEGQTFKGKIQWIIVTDEPGFITPTTTAAHIEILHVKSKLHWTPEINTQRANMTLALPKVKYPLVAVWEDDERYGPTYLQTTVDFLRYVDVVGETNSKYYHVGIPGWKEMQNYKHASLCQTAFRATALPMLIKSVQSGELYFDIHFWKQVLDKRVPAVLHSDSNLVIGMKGLPGRVGIGVGHKTSDYRFDSNLAKLSQWIGKDVELYKGFTRYAKSSKETSRFQKSSQEDSIEGRDRSGSSSGDISLVDPKSFPKSESQKPAVKKSEGQIKKAVNLLNNADRLKA